MNNGGFGGGMVGQGMSSQGVQNQAPMTPEQQLEIIEAQRYNALQNGDPVLPKILPPTAHSQEIEGLFGGNGGAPPPPAPD